MHLRLLLVVGLLFLATPVSAAPVSVTVDISDQKMYVRVGAFTRYTWDVSTARRNYRTPVGSFRPIRMYVKYYSKKYHGSPMPYSIFFYGGYAIHGTMEVSRLGTPASHGCIRLDPKHAEKLYSLVKKNGTDNTTIKVRS
jgi:lipoprotein-anchoring transpeptidase ErfK/SrfK